MNKPHQTKIKLIETENKLIVVRREEAGEVGKKVKRNIVSNSLITLHSDRGLLDLMWFSYC